MSHTERTSTGGWHTVPDTGPGVWVWVVGGGPIQAPLVREFRNRGYGVAIGDRDRDCFCSKGFGDSVRVFEADVYSVYQQLTACQHAEALFGRPPSGVMTAGTDAGESVSTIASLYQLPAVSPEAAGRAAHKHIMREKVKLEHPWYRYGAAPTPLEYPAVVKPSHSSASRGVSLVQGPEELPEAYQKARKASRTQDEPILVEEALDHQIEASTDWFVEGGHLYYVNGAWRWFDSEIFGMESGFLNPFLPENCPSHAPFGQIHSLAHIAATALGVDKGPFKIDVTLDHRYGWCLLECATRWSGSFDHSHAAFWSTSRNLSAPLADFALGKPFDTSILRYDVVDYVACYTPLITEGTIIGPTMFRELRSNWGVIEVIATRQEAVRFSNLSDRPLFIFARAETETKAKEIAREAWINWLAYERTMNAGGGDH